MASQKYRVIVSEKAGKFLKSIHKQDSDKIYEHIYALGFDPHPRGSIKMHGLKNAYRIRYGNYRIIYQIENHILTVFIIDIGHRKDIYKM